MKRIVRKMVGNKFLLVLAAIVITGVILVSCGGGGGGGYVPVAASAQIVVCPSSGTTNVTIQDFSFTSPAVTISTNGIVKWTNNGPSLHTVTSSGGKFNSGNLGVGANVCIQFMTAGSYPYYCAIHPTLMTGNVTVQ